MVAIDVISTTSQKEQGPQMSNGKGIVVPGKEQSCCRPDSDPAEYECSQLGSSLTTLHRFLSVTHSF